MNRPAPFAYPTTPIDRRHHPKGYSTYDKYKPWLRDEFTFRCVYCLTRETWYPSGPSAFSADHFEARSLKPERELDYLNLVYACLECNSYKQDYIAFLDPTVVAFASHFHVDDAGHIIGLTLEAKDLIDLLDLDSPDRVDVRMEHLNLVWAYQEAPKSPSLHQVVARRFGFPNKLPNLRGLRPPEGNAKKDSDKGCFYERGPLPEFY